jgi:hypothetical protein
VANHLDWVTISSLATGAGTLALAVSTFASVRSANRAARVAEQALLVGVRPLLVPSWLTDGVQKIYFGDGRRVVLAGGCAVVEVGETEEMEEPIVYLAISLRNAGQGIGVIHGWRFQPGREHAEERPDPGEFRLQARDLYIPPSDMGFWQGAIREPGDPLRDGALKAIESRERLMVDVLYGDIQGGQRAVSRFMLQPPGGAAQPGGGAQPGGAAQPEGGAPPGGEAELRDPAQPGGHAQRWIASVIRHWRVDGHDPR